MLQQPIHTLAGATPGGPASASGRTVVLIYSNCQGEEMHRIMSRVPCLRDRVEFRLIAYHAMHRPERSWEVFGAGWMADIGIIWEQLGADYPENRARFHALRPAAARTVRFPAITALFLWPFTGADPRISFDDPLYPSGRFQWTDSVAADVMKHAPASAGDDELFRLYMRLSADRLPNLNRRLAMDERRWRERDAEADVTLADYVMQNFRRQRLFYTYGRVTAPPLRYLLEQLCARSLAECGAPLAQINAEVAALLTDYTGQDFEQVPIHPLVAEHFALEFHDPAATYRYHANEWTFREYILNNIRNAPHLR